MSRWRRHFRLHWPSKDSRWSRLESQASLVRPSDISGCVTRRPATAVPQQCLLLSKSTAVLLRCRVIEGNIHSVPQHHLQFCHGRIESCLSRKRSQNFAFEFWLPQLSGTRVCCICVKSASGLQPLPTATKLAHFNRNQWCNSAISGNRVIPFN